MNKKVKEIKETDVPVQAEATAPEIAPEAPQDTCATRYDARIHTIYLQGAMRATASVNINGEFAIRGIRVVEGKNGLFVSSPGYKAANGEWKDYCFPCTAQSRTQFNSAVLAAYDQALAQNQSQVQCQDALGQDMSMSM